MKTLSSIIVGLLLAVTVSAQTNAVVIDTNAPPTLPQVVTNVVGFLSATASNWVAVPYAIYSEDSKSIGAGVGIAYALNKYSLTMVRLDFIEDELFMPSGNIQLQLPLTIAGNFQATPFIFGGIATPLGGRGDDNGEVTGIAGTGLAVGITKKLGAAYSIEHWSRFSGQQHRFGIFWKF